MTTPHTPNPIPSQPIPGPWNPVPPPFTCAIAFESHCDCGAKICQDCGECIRHCNC